MCWPAFTSERNKGPAPETEADPTHPLSATNSFAGRCRPLSSGSSQLALCGSVSLRTNFPYIPTPLLMSALDSYAPLIERLTKEGKAMLLLPELQEVNDLPCDTGSVSPHPH